MRTRSRFFFLEKTKLNKSDSFIHLKSFCSASLQRLYSLDFIQTYISRLESNSLCLYSSAATTFIPSVSIRSFWPAVSEVLSNTHILTNHEWTNFNAHFDHNSVAFNLLYPRYLKYITHCFCCLSISLQMTLTNWLNAFLIHTFEKRLDKGISWA